MKETTDISPDARRLEKLKEEDARKLKKTKKKENLNMGAT